MRVIKQGTKEKGWRLNVTCTGKGNGGHGCGSELELTIKDVYQTSGSDYYYKTFCCVVCGTETDLESNVRVPFMSGKRPIYEKRKALALGHALSAQDE